MGGEKVSYPLFISVSQAIVKKDHSVQFGRFSGVLRDVPAGKNLADLVVSSGASFGVAHDGDADRMIIVDFWAPTCMPCRLMEPGLEKIAASHQGNVQVLKVNVNESPKTSSRFMVRTLPTLLFIKDGQVKTQIIGAVNPNQIEKTLIEVG